MRKAKRIKTKARRRNRTKNWIEASRQATLRREAGDLRDARTVFDKELSLNDQMRLARELVATRAAELCRAYPDVVTVSYGFKRKARGKAQKPSLTDQPCIRFTVPRKWRTKGRPKDSRRLPEFLYAYWLVGGERKLCAIATDVEDAAQEARTRPASGPSGIIAAAPGGGTTEDGMIACVVERSAAQGNKFVISCRHVFSMTHKLHPRVIDRGAVSLSAGGAQFAETCKVVGDLHDGPGFSLDAQLARVVDPGALSGVLGNVKLTGYVRTPDDIPARYRQLYIQTSSGPVRADCAGYSHGSIDYDAPGATKVVHKELLDLIKTPKVIVGGDSGAAVTTELGGGLLAGMIVSSDRASSCRAIPAWDLLDPSKYNGADDSEVWALV